MPVKSAGYGESRTAAIALRRPAPTRLPATVGRLILLARRVRADQQAAGSESIFFHSRMLGLCLLRIARAALDVEIVAHGAQRGRSTADHAEIAVHLLTHLAR